LFGGGGGLKRRKMANKLEQKLSNFFDKNPQFKGKFIGYKQSRGGLGVSRIDNDWYECEDYLINLESLIEALTESDEIDLT